MIQKKKFPAVINKDLPYNENPVASDALNITNLGNDERSARDVAPILGNYPAFDLGSVSQQNKIYRILIPATGTYQVTVKATDNSTVLFTANFSDILTAIVQINIQAAGSGNNANITSGSGFIDIELLPNPAVQAYRWYMTSTGTDELTIQVRQEAIEPTLAGELLDIGGFDLLGDLFIWSTSQRNLPTVLSGSITNATNATPIVITLAAHGLVTNQWVLITGIQGNTAANGNWSVQVITANSFSLVNSTGNGVYTTGGAVTVYPSGIGEIGVAQKNMVTLEWTYIRLLRSVEWNWNTKKQFDVYCEETATLKNLYGTNDYSPPMVFYTQSPYVQDGGLAFNGGQYEYDSVFDETRLFLSVLNTQIEFTNQLQGGGASTAGNKRYAVRALTETATTTDWSDVTNPVNVFSASTTGNPEKIVGDVAGTVTAKVNVLTVSNIQADIFKYIEVACIEYVGLAITGFIVNRYLITGSTMVIQHTGNEATTDLAIEELQAFTVAIDTAKNIRAIDNRLIISNLRTVTDEDLSNVFNQVRHSVVRKTVDSVFFSSVDGVNYGEYQDPNNVNDNMGLMINDSYRFSGKLRYKIGGAWTKNFWIDDIIVNNSAVNTANPFGDNRRIAGLPNLDLTINTLLSPPLTVVPYIEFTNVNFDYILQDGRRLGDIFDAVSFERAECIPEILFTGLSGMSAATTNVGTPTGLFPRPEIHATAQNLEDYNNMILSSGVPVYPYRKTFVIYSPDILLGNNGFTFTGNDKVINFGNPISTYILPFGTYPDQGFIEFQGNNLDNPTSVTIDVNDSKTISPLQSVSINGIPFVNIGVGGVPSTLVGVGGQLVDVVSDLTTVNNFDYGYYYVQYYRPLTNKYGDINSSEYVTCGNLYLIDGATTATTFDVLGGDTFTQKTYFQVFCNNNAGGIGVGNTGFGFYSQNRINSQMRQKSDLATEKVFPSDASGTTPVDRVIDWLTNGVAPELLAYDDSYNIINGVDYHTTFDPNLIPNDDQPTRIRWSPLKPQNAIADLYRAFLPLDFFDIDNSFGEIMHHENFNGELFALQPKKWLRMFFNTRGILQIQSVADVVIGDGSVMSRPGITISNFGCSNKWSAFKGKSKGGNDVMYWWDNINKMIMRFGGDGTLSISEIKGLEAFCANSFNWVVANDTPADGKGIHGAWGQRFGEATWVVREYRGSAETPSSGTPQDLFLLFEYIANGVPMIWENYPYPVNAIVFYVPTTFSTFNQTGEFWRSLVNNNNNVPSLTNATWEVIPHTDINYWNEFSIKFNEKLNEVTQGQSPSGFESYLTPLPFIIHEWNNGMIAPRPISPLSLHYESNRGEYLEWWLHNGISQTEEAYIELVVNQDTDLPKLFLALVVNSENPPFKISFFTKGHQSFILSADFEAMNNVWQAAIKNDTLTSVPPGLNNQDTSQLFGTYIRVRFHFTPKQYNSVSDFVMKFNALYRNYTG